MPSTNESWRRSVLWIFGAAAVLGCADPAPGAAVADPAGQGASPAALAQTSTLTPTPTADTLARQAVYARKVRELQSTIAHLPAAQQQEMRAALKLSIMEK